MPPCLGPRDSMSCEQTSAQRHRTYFLLNNKAVNCVKCHAHGRSAGRRRPGGPVSVATAAVVWSVQFVSPLETLGESWLQIQTHST